MRKPDSARSRLKGSGKRHRRHAPPSVRAPGQKVIGEAPRIGGNVPSVDIQRLGAFHEPRHGLTGVAVLQVVEELGAWSRAHGDAQAEDGVGREDDGIADSQSTGGLFQRERTARGDDGLGDAQAVHGGARDAAGVPGSFPAGVQARDIRLEAIVANDAHGA